MLNSINITHIWVFDQNEALDFYVGKLGLWIHRRLHHEELPGLPVTHFYSTDIGIRDPFGNHLRIVQLAQPPNQQ